MAHLENGYSQIANETLEALARIRLSGNERRLLDVVFRLSYGFNRKWARISMRTYAQRTGIDFRDCQKIEKRLRDRNVVIRDRGRVRFQKYSEKWKNVGVNHDGKRKLEGLRKRDKTGKRRNVGGKPDVGDKPDKTVGDKPDTLKKDKEILIKTSGQEFVRIWEKLLILVRTSGRWHKPTIDDLPLDAVVKQIGWTTLCDMTKWENRELRTRFIDLYAEEIIKRRSSK